MTRRKLVDICVSILTVALLAWQIWKRVEDFQAFQATNAGSGVSEYFANLGLSFWSSLVVGSAVLALIVWWGRSGGDAEQADPDSESKRMFMETHGD